MEGMFKFLIYTVAFEIAVAEEAFHYSSKSSLYNLSYNIVFI